MGVKLSSHSHQVVPVFVKSQKSLRLPTIPECHIAPFESPKQTTLQLSYITTVYNISQNDGDCLQLESLEDEDQTAFITTAPTPSSSSNL